MYHYHQIESVTFTVGCMLDAYCKSVSVPSRLTVRLDLRLEQAEFGVCTE